MTNLTSYDKVTIRDWYDNKEYTQEELAEIWEVSRSTIQRVLAERPIFVEMNQMDTDCPPYDGCGQELFMDESQDDSPPKWVGIGLVVLTLCLTAFVGWVIHHAL